MRNEIEAMQVICNIQAMKEVITGNKPDYKTFKNYSCEELHLLQNSLIKDYNYHVKLKSNH